MNEEVFSTSEHNENRKEKRSETLPGKYEGGRITSKVYGNTLSWKIDERDEKPYSRCYVLVYKIPLL